MNMRIRSRLPAWLLGSSLAVAAVAAAQVTPPAPGEPGAPPPAETPSPTPSPAAPASAADAAEAARQKAEIERNARLKRPEEGRKLLATEQSARALAELGPLGTYQGASGTVTVDTSNNAVMEATILATRSLDEIGYAMGGRLADAIRQAPFAAGPRSAPPPVPGDRAGMCAEVRANGTFLNTPAVRPVIIVAATGATLTDQADSFMLRTAALGRELCAALTARTRRRRHRHRRRPDPGSRCRRSRGAASPRSPPPWTPSPGCSGPTTRSTGSR